MYYRQSLITLALSHVRNCQCTIYRYTVPSGHLPMHIDSVHCCHCGVTSASVIYSQYINKILMIKITLSLGSNYKSNSYSVLLCLSLPILFEEQDLRERRPNNKHFQVFIHWNICLYTLSWMIPFNTDDSTNLYYQNDLI
jgi:hypothetical protein